MFFPLYLSHLLPHSFLCTHTRARSHTHVFNCNTLHDHRRTCFASIFSLNFCSCLCMCERVFFVLIFACLLALIVVFAIYVWPMNETAKNYKWNQLLETDKELNSFFAVAFVFLPPISFASDLRLLFLTHVYSQFNFFFLFCCASFAVCVCKISRVGTNSELIRNEILRKENTVPLHSLFWRIVFLANMIIFFGFLNRNEW